VKVKKGETLPGSRAEQGERERALRCQRPPAELEAPERAGPSSSRPGSPARRPPPRPGRGRRGASHRGAVRGEIRALPTPSAAVVDAASLGQGLLRRRQSAAAPRAPAPLPSRIEIPASGFETVTQRPSGKRASNAATTSARRRSTHTVRKGDTLFRIASRYGVTVDALRRETGSGGAARSGRPAARPAAHHRSLSGTT